MSNASSNRSLPSSDSATGSLLMKMWDKDEFERSGIEIHNLVEDKDVAAKAVTLVVNSSRKGVVSLCADVANILRAKKKLEHTIELQHKELLRLKRNGQLTVGDSNRTSRSTSPTPPSPRSFESALMQRRHSSHLALSRSTSRCSQCSSLSSSPRLERALNQSTVSTESHDSGTHHHLELLPNQYVVTAEVHRTSSACSREDAQVNQKSPDTRSKNVEMFSKEVQCSSLSDEHRELETKHRDVCNTREILEDDLQKARKEIEDLKTRLYISDDISEEQSMICDLSIENEVKGGWTETSRTDTDNRSETSINLPLLSPRDHGNQCWQGNRLVSGNRSNPYPTSPPPHPPVQQHFVSGCLCIPCQKQMQEGARQNVPSQGQTVIRGGNHRFTVHIDDRVATKGDRVGLIRYIGHLENTNSSHTVYAGLELEAPAGRHDGFINGKRYFWCHRNHGLFVPLQDIVAIVNKKPTKRPKTVDVSHQREPRGHNKHQQGGRSVDLKHKSGNRTSSGKKLISADSTSLKRSSSLPVPSIT